MWCTGHVLKYWTITKYYDQSWRYYLRLIFLINWPSLVAEEQGNSSGIIARVCWWSLFGVFFRSKKKLGVKLFENWFNSCIHPLGLTVSNLTESNSQLPFKIYLVFLVILKVVYSPILSHFSTQTALLKNIRSLYE